MKSDFLKTIFGLIVFSVTAYLMNKLLLSYTVLHIDYQKYNYSIESMYAIFLAFTVAILLILQKVKERNSEIVGVVFLLLTSLKMGISYFIFLSIIRSVQENSVEKINFFILFILYLAIDAYYTIRMLNKSQRNSG